jgi:CDP-diacylglycerol pyrophosphatase
VTWLAKTVLTDEERGYLRSLALEIADIRKQLNQLTEALAKLNDKQFLKLFSDENPVLTEKQVDDYQLSLQKQADAAENEFRY